MKARWFRLTVVVGATILATAAYVTTRPTVHYLEHVDVVGQNRAPTIEDPIDLACPPKEAFFVLERDGRVLQFDKAAPYRGREIAFIERPAALAYDRTTDSVLVLGESGHAVFRVNYRNRAVSRLFEIDDHLAHGASKTGFAADHDGHVLLNNSSLPSRAPILALASEGSIEHEFGTRQQHDDPLVEMTMNATRLRFVPDLIALNTNTGTLTSYSREPQRTVQLPLPDYAHLPRRNDEGVSVTPVFLDVAPILNNHIFVLGSGRPYVLGLILDQGLALTGVVRLSKRTPDWVAMQRYDSVCRLTFNMYALASNERLDIYKLNLN